MVESAFAGVEHLRDLASRLAFDLQGFVQQFAFYAAQELRKCELLGSHRRPQQIRSLCDFIFSPLSATGRWRLLTEPIGA